MPTDVEPDSRRQQQVGKPHMYLHAPRVLPPVTAHIPVQISCRQTATVLQISADTDAARRAITSVAAKTRAFFSELDASAMEAT
jgi:hypothetical protein